jgi:osmoprotectant transport system permease protein
VTALLEWIRTHPDLLWRTTSEHVVMSGVSLALAALIALPLGIRLARGGRATAPVLALVNALRTIPSLALLVIMLPLIGTGMLPSIVALVLYGLPAILLNTVTGLQGVDRDIVDAARGQGLSRRQVLRQIELPLASPVILAGIRNAAVQIVAAATLAVFVGGGGYGELISAGMGLFEFPQLIAGTLAVAALAGAAELSFGAAGRALSRRLGVEAVT